MRFVGFPDGVDWAHVRNRLRLARRPLVTITDPPHDVRFERDVEVVVRDGTTLRVNVFRPPGDGRHPVIMSAHPYGKDNLPKPARQGSPGWRVPMQMRMLPQSEPYTISAWTSWEAPDPAFWAARGYVVVNGDLRGWGHSDGDGTLLSAQEGRDVHDLVEWAAVQPWSNGRVGLLGVSYLAITQWAAAAERPPHLAAICPWEGFTDVYRDFARPGGVLEKGFRRLWVALLRRAAGRVKGRGAVTFGRESTRRALFDAWWADRNRDIERIDVPALVCASFSDHNLHSRGSFEGFRRISSTDKWLYTHRGPKWATFYSDPARQQQTRFFDHYLRDEDNGWPHEPRVRMEVREDATTIASVRGEDEWPPRGTRGVPLHLHPRGLLERTPPDRPGTVTFDARRGRTRFALTFDDDTEIVGPMRLRLHASLQGANDINVFAGIRKVRDGKLVGFEGSYGFDRALVTFGMLKASLRAVDPDRSLPWLPCHPCDRFDPVRPGQIVPLDIELHPSATLFRRGEQLLLDIQGRWFFPTNPVLGQFPARYERSDRGTCVLHMGGQHDAALHLPQR
jgi:predicted acyl esterase